MAIKDWHEDDRPREKLLKTGAASLSDAEILAIFLRIGSKKMSAIELARSLIAQFGGLAELLSAPADEVMACHGMGQAKYAQLQACLELGRRYLSSQLKTGVALNRSQLVKDYLSVQLRLKPREVFALLCLDNALRLIDYSVLFTGGLTSCSVCVKLVLKHALAHGASQVIIAHNHPNTPATPSAADDELTLRLQQACELVDIRFIDHVIVGHNSVFSYAEQHRTPF